MDLTPDDLPLRWSASPALPLAAGLGAGIALADTPGLPPGTWLMLGAVGLAALAFAHVFHQGRLYALKAVAVLTVALASGGAAFQAHYGLRANDVVHLAGKDGDRVDVVLTGRVRTPPVERDGSLRFLMDVREGGTAHGRYAVAGGVAVRLRRPDGDAHYPSLTQGDVVQLAGLLHAPGRRRNPADFDYGRYLRLRNVHAALTVDHPDDVRRLGRVWRLWERVVLPLRACAAARLTRAVPGSETGRLTRALVLGDRTVLDEETEKDFRRTGLTHLLAVSGTHMVFVGLMLYNLLGPLLTRLGLGWRGREWTRFVVTAFVLAVYTALTGASPSAVRAAIMVVLVIGAAALQRSSPPLNALSVAALLLLAAEPAALYDIGFQLSFAAVAGLVLLYPVLTAWIPEGWRAPRTVRWTVAVTGTSLAATLATAPVLAYHFGSVPVAGLLLNIPAIPVTALVMTSGLATVAAGPVDHLADAFGAAAHAAALGLLHTARLGDDLLGRAALPFTTGTVWPVLTLGLLLLALAAWPWHRWRFAVVLLAGLNASAWSVVPTALREGPLEVLFFDVGQGDAALVRTPAGRTLLLDVGVRHPGFDAGERTILPHLRRLGIERLDAVLVSHPHADHLGGLPALLRAVPVHMVIRNADNYATALTREVDRLADSLRILRRAAHAGDSLHLDPALRIRILSPTPELLRGPDVNEASLVVRIDHGATCLLFLGDAGLEAEQDLSPSDLACDVVKVGHHGSRTASGQALTKHVLPDTSSPSYAVVSVAAENGYGLPDEEVLARWRVRGAEVLTTAEQGAVWLRSDGREIHRVDWR